MLDFHYFFVFYFCTDKQMFLDEMKGYMPKPHRDFIDAIKKSPKVRNYVLQSNQQELIENYNTCVQNIEKFRSYHMTIVTKYVVNASSRGRREETFEKLAKRGTGGTSLIPFLKDIRHTTKESRIEVAPNGPAK
eukprot:XP_014786950.1 PREDICTED: indoleamine 2,3-dioxygenase 2-like [Octopus bimaculoides]